MPQWIVQNGSDVFKVEAANVDDAITAFFDSEPPHINMFLQVGEATASLEDRFFVLALRELLTRHRIKNADVARLLNSMGMDSVPDDNWYQMLKANAKWWKSNKESKGYGKQE